MSQQMATLMTILRPPAPTGGKIGPVADTGTTALVSRQPASAQQIADVGGMVLYRSYMLITVGNVVPDVRLQDVLIDPGDIDPETKAPAHYIVRGVRNWLGHHLSILAERQAGA